MSLVSEALKKAEREAAAREARDRGQPAPLESPRQPYRAPRKRQSFGRWPWLLLGAGIVGAVVLILRSPVGSEAGNAPTTAEPANASKTSSENPAPTPSAAPALAAEPTPSPRAEIASPPPPGVDVPRQTARPAPPPSTPAPEEPRSATATRGRSDEFVRVAELPDGSKLTLGGIAYSESAPFAYLNGKLLKVGEGTAGYTLTRIERDRVVVRGAGGEIVLRLKPR